MTFGIDYIDKELNSRRVTIIVIIFIIIIICSFIKNRK